MDLVVRTFYNTLVMNGVDGNCEIIDLKNIIHQRGEQEHIPFPVASKQRLVFKGSILTSGTLHNAGVRSGDHLVLLLHRAHGNTTSRPVDTTPVPTATTIRNAIISEARRRGIENTIVEEPPRAFRHFGGMAREVDQHLLQLVHALQGRPMAAEARAGQPRQTSGAGEEVAAAAGPPVEAGAADAGGGRRHLQVGMMPPGMMLFGMPSQPAASAAAAAPPPQPAIPEPDVQAAAQLGEMGFGEAVVRKALLLHRNDMEAALNWLLQHGDDPAAAEPLTDEQLRQIYSRGPRGPPSEPELVEQLVSMGFERNQSADALRRFRNMDMALAYLLRTADEGGEQQPPGSSTEGASTAAAEADTLQAPGQEVSGLPRFGDGGAQPAAAGGEARQGAAGPERSGSGMQARGDRNQAARTSGGGDSVELPELALSDGEDDMLLDRVTGRLAQAAGGDQNAADESASLSQTRGVVQQPGVDLEVQGRALVGTHDVQRGEGEEEGDDMDEDDEGEEEDGVEEEEEEEDDEDDDDFTGGDGMPTMIEQLAMGQGPGAGRGTMLHMPLGGVGLRLGGAAMSDDSLTAIGAFEAPFALYGGLPHGVRATTSAMAVTRGPDGNELVLGSAGATMPPLMPARGMLLGGMGLGEHGGGGLGLVAQPLDLTGLLQGGGAGDEEMQGMGLVQQLLSAVLRDAMGGGEGAPGATLSRR